MNQYTAVGAVTPTYDSRGNISSGYGGGLMLSYDMENRLVSGTLPGVGSVNYGYDLLGRRISRFERVGHMLEETIYVWDGDHVIAEYVDGSLAKKYIYGPGIDQPVAMINVGWQSETWYYYYADALGSVRLMTDAAGVAVESYAYDAFGLPTIMRSAGPDGNWLTEDVTGTYFSPIDNPYLFTGRRWDGDTMLYYYRFRDYSPQLGRFLQPDPAGYIDTMNLYAYCGNNPVNWIDPWGLCKSDVGLGGPSISLIGGLIIIAPGAGEVAISIGVVTVVFGAAVTTADAYGIDDLPAEVVDSTSEIIKDLYEESNYYDENPDELIDDILGW